MSGGGMQGRAAPWSVTIDNLETRLRVGIWDHEREHQPVRVTVSVGPAPGALHGQEPGGVSCQPIMHWIAEEWPHQPHTPLLETRLRELMAFVFAFDPRIGWLDAALSKPLACPQAAGVGVRMALSRRDFTQLFGAPGAAAAAECPT
jgi:dihydroneopterin aldolase